MCAKSFGCCFLFGATPAHEPERPSEPWLKGVHPREEEWKTRSYLEERSSRTCGLLKDQERKKRPAAIRKESVMLSSVTPTGVRGTTRTHTAAMC